MVGLGLKQCVAGLVVAGFGWLVLLPTQPAAAAADLLVASDPYRHQELATPPDGVVLAFSRAVDAAAAQIVVANSSGGSVNVNTLIVEGTNVTAQVRPNLPQGTYTVHYRVNRADGDIEGGAFQFAYGKGTWTSLPDERWSGRAEQPSVLVSPSIAPTPTATESASSSATASTQGTPSTQPPTPSPSPTAVPASDAGNGPWPWVAGVALVLVVGGAGATIAARRGRSRAAARRD